MKLSYFNALTGSSRWALQGKSGIKEALAFCAPTCSELV